MMKIYEAFISKRLIISLEQKIILSLFRTAYRQQRSTAQHILTLNEIFQEYRLNKVRPRGCRSKRRLFLCFHDMKKDFDMVSR